MSDIEPMSNGYDWYEAFRQNPGQTEFDWPEEADEAAARVLAEQAAAFLDTMK